MAATSSSETLPLAESKPCLDSPSLSASNANRQGPGGRVKKQRLAQPEAAQDVAASTPLAKRSAIKPPKEPQFKVGHVVQNKSKRSALYAVTATCPGGLAVQQLHGKGSYPMFYGPDVFEPCEPPQETKVTLDDQTQGLLVLMLAAIKHNSTNIDLVSLLKELTNIPEEAMFQKISVSKARAWLATWEVAKPKEYKKIRKEITQFVELMQLKETPDDAATTESTDLDAEQDEPISQDAQELHPDNQNISLEVQQESAKIQAVVQKLKEKNLLHRCAFNVLGVLRRVEELLLSAKLGNDPFNQIGAGQTQVGKSMLKQVIAMLAVELGCIAIIVTPGSTNCKELKAKLSKAIDDDILVEIVAGGGVQKMMVDAFRRDGRKGIFVSNFSHSQLRRVNDLLEETPEADRRKVVVLLDEADDFLKNRLDGPLNKQELQLNDMLARFAHLYVEITASPVPLIVKRLRPSAVKPNMDPRDFIVLTGGAKYLGIDQLETYTQDGEQVFLDPGELNVGNCYFNTEKVINFLDEAIKVEKSLVVMVTNPRLNAMGGVVDAGKELAYIYAEEGVMIISVTGGGIDYRLQHPGADPAQGKFEPLGKKMNDRNGILQVTSVGFAIDHLVSKFNWDGTIVVVGYTMLNRGVTLHCDTRVPTHIIASLTGGQIAEKVLQAFGRGTGNFRDVLEEPAVKILTTKSELDLVRQYQTFVTSFHAELVASKGDFNRAFRFATTQAPVLSSSGKRPVGHRKYGCKDKVATALPECNLLPDVQVLRATPPKKRAKLMEELGIEFTPNEPETFEESWSLESELRLRELAKRYLQDVQPNPAAAAELSEAEEEGDDDDSGDDDASMGESVSF